VIIGALGVLPAFAIGRRLAGTVSGLLAALLIALNPLFLVRSIGSDNDVWNVVLPLYLMWAAMRAADARTLWQQAIYVLFGRSPSAACANGTGGCSPMRSCSADSSSIWPSWTRAAVDQTCLRAPRAPRGGGLPPCLGARAPRRIGAQIRVCSQRCDRSENLPLGSAGTEAATAVADTFAAVAEMARRTCNASRRDCRRATFFIAWLACSCCC
jgi:hypothetical protein